MKVDFKTPAAGELYEAFEWYELQSVGLGTQFVAAVQAVIARICQFPGSYPKRSKYARRALVPKFPFAIWYRYHDDTLTIYAIAHTNRRPAYWSDRAP